ncbi:hypothetical protein GU700_08480 [Methylobacterium sp. NI91]|nr:MULTISPECIES: hypothetical protein [unclassified Methylobacterium]QIJ74610.1 hypothetical protein CLZ_08480 [Methylobacterium sp. CLZ]QIJ79515.1 hypothetical protein GU700_08480 [Methylobacterium sp. NI91]
MDYVEETRFAAESLFPLIFHERDEVEALRKKLSGVEWRLADMYRRMDWLARNPEFDDEGIGTAIHWEAHFDVEPEHIKVDAELKDVEARINARSFARAALCGNLLQTAKQGLSIVHQGLNGPTGRSIGTQAIRDVIWQARNQAIHFEEGNLRPAVRQCFETLAIDLNRPELRDYHQRSLAYEVFESLGWNSYADYERDLRSLV